MTLPNPYVRERLAATRRGVASAEVLVDLWAARLFGLLEEVDGAPTSTQAYEVIAGWARLLRCDPGTIEALGASARWESASGRVQANLAAWLPAALTVPEPEGWLREAAGLAEAWDDDAPAEELAEWAEQLLCDLDDADLVAWAARREGRADAALEEGLAKCAGWLAENPDRFFAAGVFVQGVGRALRPELPGFDLGLAGAADKFVVLLDALEDIEERMGEVPTVRLEHPSWRDFPKVELVLAAEVEEEAMFRRLWRSPDGEGTARLVMEPRQKADAVVRVRIKGASGPVRFAGLEAAVSEGGFAEYRYEDLVKARQAGAPLSLVVNGVEWTLTRE